MKGQAATVASLLDDATRQLAATLGLQTREARLEARVLAAHAWQVSPAWLIAHDTDPATSTQQLAFESLLARRQAGEPVAYILGEREFFGLGFAVTPAVLIPRPDTELLVNVALQYVPEHTPCRILDLGTGSGVIAITLARQRPMANVVAVDASIEALAVAQTDPHLDAGDLRFEPRQALASGNDGLHDLRLIVAGAPMHLVKDGWLLLEHGYDQADAVMALLQQHGFTQTATQRDLAGLNRVSGGRWPGEDQPAG
ncbi:MAG: modification methylase HemK [Proteobacteria bacterium]|nr:modification methylase HemK [Pseudomonadota bacterium]